MSGFAATFRNAMHREPVVVFSCLIGLVGKAGCWPAEASQHLRLSAIMLQG